MAVRRSLFPTTPSSASKKAKYATPSSVAKTIRNMTETKYKGTNGTFLAAGLGAQSSRTPLTQIDNGADVEERVGNKIQVQSVDLNLTCLNTGPVRVVFLAPKDPSVSWDASQTITTQIDPKSYWVLYDKIHDCHTPLPTTTGSTTAYHGPGFTIKLKRKMNVEYFSTAGNSYSRNPLFFVVIPANPNFSTTGFTGSISGNARTWYKDY